jgi:predicted AlkP superfamily pyrophosphatase or phosphodiesterase
MPIKRALRALRTLGRIAFVACLVCTPDGAGSFALGDARAGSVEPAGPKSDRCVILVSLDGFAHFYLDDPLTQVPTIRQLVHEGAAAVQGMECSFPTVTWPNHTTLVTGVPPSKHGVLANVVFDREKGETVQLLVDPVFDKSEIVKVPTIYDAAHHAGLKTAAIVWPATRNAKTLHWTVPDMKTPLFERFSTPGWLDELKAEGIPVDRYGAWVESKEGGPRRDWMATREVISLLRRHDRPNLILLHLIELDHAQHEFGPRTGDARWAASTMDDRVRDLRDAIEAEGLRDKVTLIVTSDHGFFATENTIAINSLLRENGYIKMENGKVASKDVWSVSQGGSAAIYILPRERRTEIVAALRWALTPIEGIEAIYSSPKDFQKLGQALCDEDRFGADMWVTAKEGYSFSNDPVRNIVDKDSKVTGTHGYMATHPQMRGIFVAWGAGIKPDSKLSVIRNTQVAPTIARLLGLDFPTADDRPLSGALLQ